eukprot:gene12966-8822_t
MSGENIANLLAQQNKASEEAHGPTQAQNSMYTGKYQTHLEEQIKPSYSTFWERGKEYDCTHSRFYKQRDAIIGKNVGDDVDPKMFLRRGQGVRYIVPPIHEDKIIRNPPVDHNRSNAFGGGKNNNGNGSEDGKGPNSPGVLGDDANNRNLGDESGNGASNNGMGATWPGSEGNIDGYGASGRRREEPYKDFISSNIVEVSNMVPRRRKLQPEFATDRKDFGQVPAYLNRVKNDIEREKDFFSALAQKKDNRDQVYSKYVYRLTDEERRDLIAKLRKKLDEKTMTLMRMPMSDDSLPTSKRKGELQDAIRDLEKAIAKIDRETIFVYKDDPVNGEWAKNAALKEARQYAVRAQKGEA